MKDDKYYFHQTPRELTEKLIKYVDFQDDDIVLEPFKGEGAFYDVLPNNIVKHWCEIEEGVDYKDFDGKIDWVITNPPFKLDGKSVFFELLKYYSSRVNKGICFLGSDYCFCSLTPKRIKELNNEGLYLDKLIVTSIKKWRGRYFFMIFKKQKNNFLEFVEGNF